MILQGVLSPLVGQMFFRATLFSAFGASKRWLAQNADGSPRDLTITDYYAAGAMTGFAAAFVEGPIDFYKSQVQVQIIRSQGRTPQYKRASPPHRLLVKIAHCPQWVTPFIESSVALRPVHNCASLPHRQVITLCRLSGKGQHARLATSPVCRLYRRHTCAYNALFRYHSVPAAPFTNMTDCVRADAAGQRVQGPVPGPRRHARAQRAGQQHLPGQRSRSSRTTSPGGRASRRPSCRAVSSSIAADGANPLSLLSCSHELCCHDPLCSQRPVVLSYKSALINAAAPVSAAGGANLRLDVSHHLIPVRLQLRC